MTRTAHHLPPTSTGSAAHLAAPAPEGRGRPRARRPLTALAVAVALAAALAACSGSGAGGDEAMSVGDAGGSAPQELADRSEDGTGPTTSESERQVVQTGEVYVAVADPHEGVREVVALVERVDGRVDDRYERAATEDDPGSATLTVRVPADEVDAVTAELDEIGDVEELTITREDVTAAAQDLDARIEATELSVARMEDLLASARTSAAVIDAEQALTDRQSTLEQLRSQRARVADQVALSTLHVQLYAPDGTPVPQAGPRTFLDGLASGWSGLVEAVRATLVVVGVLVPWAALGALVVVPVVLVRRARRTRPAAAPAAGTGSPAPDQA